MPSFRETLEDLDLDKVLARTKGSHLYFLVYHALSQSSDVIRERISEALEKQKTEIVVMIDSRVRPNHGYAKLAFCLVEQTQRNSQTRW